MLPLLNVPTADTFQNVPDATFPCTSINQGADSLATFAVSATVPTGHNVPNVTVIR